MLDLNIFKKTKSEKEIEEFTNQRKFERDVFESALHDWLLKSGLGEVMLEQTEEFAIEAGLDGWPDQFEMYRQMEFDPRNPRHAEIMEYIND